MSITIEKANQYYDSLKQSMGSAFSSDDAALVNIELYPIALELARIEELSQSVKNQLDPNKASWYLETLESMSNMNSLVNTSIINRRKNLAARYLIFTQVASDNFLDNELSILAPNLYISLVKNSWYNQNFSPVLRLANYNLDQVNQNVQTSTNIANLQSGLSLPGGVSWSYTLLINERSFTSSTYNIYVTIKTQVASGLSYDDYNTEVGNIKTFLDNVLPAFCFYYVVDSMLLLDADNNLDSKKYLS
jgi:hypothetical protein